MKMKNSEYHYVKSGQYKHYSVHFNPIPLQPHAITPDWDYRGKNLKYFAVFFFRKRILHMSICH